MERGWLPSVAFRSPGLSLADTSPQSCASLWQPLLGHKSLFLSESLECHFATF